MTPRIHTTGNAKPWIVTSQLHRRDAAWRAQVHGTRLLPMERPSWLARIFGRAR